MTSRCFTKICVRFSLSLSHTRAHSVVGKMPSSIDCTPSLNRHHSQAKAQADWHCENTPSIQLRLQTSEMRFNQLGSMISFRKSS